MLSKWDVIHDRIAYEKMAKDRDRKAYEKKRFQELEKLAKEADHLMDRRKCGKRKPINILPPGFVSATEWAKENNLTMSYIKKLLHEQKIIAVYHDDDWYFDEQQANAYIRRMEQRIFYT